MENLIYDYFVRPIVEHTGYNMVNTLTYALIAIAAIYLIRKALAAGKVRIDRTFIAGALAFVLLGSTMRVVTDSIDTGAFKAVTPLHGLVLQSHLLDYGYLTVTPGIYVVTAALYLASLCLAYVMKKPKLPIYAGLALWLPMLLLLLPFMRYLVYAIPVVVLAAIPAYLAWRYLKDPILAAIVAGQALDGAATFFVIDFFSSISGIGYFEQHVLSSAIGQVFGTFFAFYLLKVGISFAAAYVLKKEKMDEEDRYYIALVLMIMGFAPGIRDVLRMVVAA